MFENDPKDTRELVANLYNSEKNELTGYDDRNTLSLKDKIQLSETFKKLDGDSICKVVNLIYQNQPAVIEDADEEKLHIRVDLINKSLFYKVIRYVYI